MLEHLKRYFEEEYRQTARAIHNKYTHNKVDCVWYAVQRCLGATMLAEIANESIPYEDYDNLYNEYREKFDLLLEEEEGAEV